MPRVLLVNGIKIYVYSLDHNPPHVHYFEGGDGIIISLVDCSVIASRSGCSPRFARDAVDAVTENLDLLRVAWDHFNS